MNWDGVFSIRNYLEYVNYFVKFLSPGRDKRKENVSSQYCIVDSTQWTEGCETNLMSEGDT